MEMRKFIGISIVTVVSALLLGGCATSRSVVTPEIATTAGPAQGPAVRIMKVEDQRVFRLEPDKPYLPSLSDNAIQDNAVTSRAIARKRNTYGKALGDVLLPEKQTVAGLTQTAIEQGFREAGYRVLKPGQPGYDDALPVTATINQFWAWMTPGFWAISLEQTSEVVVKAPIKSFEGGATINAQTKESMQFAGEDAWKEIVAKSLADLVRGIKTKLGSI
jgi:hypothetical protein